MKTRLLRMSALCSILLATATFIPSAFADVTGNSGNSAGNPIAIPDNDPGGIVSTVTITENEIINEAKFCIEGLDHDFVGDLIITVQHSTSGQMATLVHRVQQTSNPNSVGDSSNVNGTYEFADNLPNGAPSPSIWTAAANGDTNFTVPAATYAASGVGEAVVDLNTIFGGQTTAGTWTFNISDNNGGSPTDQTGTFLRTSVKFDSTAAIPEPGALGILAIGTLIGITRRRRRKVA